MPNLIATNVRVQPLAAPDASPQQLVGVERRRDRQQGKPGACARARLDLVEDVLAEQLVAAADAEDWPPHGGARGERAIETGAAQAREVLDGGLGAGHDDEVRALH